MREHRVVELLEDLCAAVAYMRPDDVNKFLLQQLEMRQTAGKNILPLFTEKEIENIYFLQAPCEGIIVTKDQELINKFHSRSAMRPARHATGLL